jgi:hypothetical protein
MFARWNPFALLLSAVTLCGCGYSAADLCEDVCDCTGCSEQELDECIDNAEDQYDRAVDEGCEDQADEYLSCLGDEGECRDGAVYDADGCESELAELNQCGASVTPGGNACESAQEMCGGSGPIECSGQVECFASCIVAAGNCTADTIATCGGQCPA